MPIPEHAICAPCALPSHLQFLESYRDLTSSSPVRILCSDAEERGVEGDNLATIARIRKLRSNKEGL
jgi:hypothetical protein